MKDLGVGIKFELSKDHHYLLGSIVRLLAFIGFCIALWNCLVFYFDSKTPLFVVSTVQMRPTFQRGSLLVVAGSQYRNLTIGDVVICRSGSRKVVYRIIGLQNNNNKSGLAIFTKSDRYLFDNIPFYQKRKTWLDMEDIDGIVINHIPFAGLITTFTEQNPLIAYALTIVTVILFAFRIE